jgi:hypothetical protein
MKSAPRDGRWLLIYGVQFATQGTPRNPKPDWYRVHWTPEEVNDEGEIAPGYWDLESSDCWVGKPQAWLPIPPAPDHASLEVQPGERRASRFRVKQ